METLSASNVKGVGGLSLADAIRYAAIATFVEFGYEKASMDAVALRAQTTKRTVYAHFHSKEGLFRAALEQAVVLFMGELPPLGPGHDPQAELEAFATAFSNLCTWRNVVRLQRVAMAEAERFPDLGAMLHRDAIVQTERKLAAYLMRMARVQGLPDAGETDAWFMAMAGMLLNMTTGGQRFATLLQARAPAPHHPLVMRPPAEDTPWIGPAVRIFLHGLGCETGPPREGAAGLAP